MNEEQPNPEALAEEIEATQEKLDALEKEIEEIGEPAAHELTKRLDALKVEERALRRNFAEALAESAPDEERLEKVQKLLTHIEAEEAALEHEADFLHQAAPSSAE
ncbi:MAG: hypothetical protein HKO57_15495, partial [Akkermansiaceae bacterium]|nr:hypothetical protein [Akkermansiaceae bacterium]